MFKIHSSICMPQSRNVWKSGFLYLWIWNTIHPWRHKVTVSCCCQHMCYKLFISHQTIFLVWNEIFLTFLSLIITSSLSHSVKTFCNYHIYIYTYYIICPVAYFLPTLLYNTRLRFSSRQLDPKTFVFDILIQCRPRSDFEHSTRLKWSIKCITYNHISNWTMWPLWTNQETHY